MVCWSNDDENESEPEKKSEESDGSDSEAQSDDEGNGENEPERASSRSSSVNSNESVTDGSGTMAKNGTKPLDDTAGVDEFTNAWKQVFLGDLDMEVSDNVKIVRIFTSSTFTGTVSSLSTFTDTLCNNATLTCNLPKELSRYGRYFRLCSAYCVLIGRLLACRFQVEMITLQMVSVFVLLDTFVERNTLMEKVYPRLKSYCQERGYDFQVVDMRWGVRDESTDDHMTTELCMRELRACQKLSTGPNFIVSSTLK